MVRWNLITISNWGYGNKKTLAEGNKQGRFNRVFKMTLKKFNILKNFFYYLFLFYAEY
jgi:hypothetical protein